MRLLIGLVGAAGSGKTTIAEHLVKSHGFQCESFASALKDVVASIFCWNRADLDGNTPESRSWRETVDAWWSARLNMSNLTPRTVLQTIGTDVMRDTFSPDIWIASIQRRLQKYGTESRVVVSDCRFQNEIEAVRSEGGYIIAVVRPGCERSGHVTETAVNESAADHVIVNDGTLEDLLKKIDNII